MSNVYQKTEINDKEEIWIILWFLKVQCCSFEEDITKFSPIQCCCMVQCCRSRQKKSISCQSFNISHICIPMYAEKLYKQTSVFMPLNCILDVKYTNAFRQCLIFLIKCDF